jgi:hypothetical protein
MTGGKTSCCLVVREGEKEEIDAERLVHGNIIIIDSGQLIPADTRIIGNSELQVNESALTGNHFRWISKPILWKKILPLPNAPTWFSKEHQSLRATSGRR